MYAMNDKKVLIIDDHPVFRVGLKSVIGASSHFKIAGEAGTAAEGLRMATALKPDLLLIDISLPDKNGIELTREIRFIMDTPAILIVSAHEGVSYISAAFQAGANGYVAKVFSGEILLAAMAAVVNGECFLDSSVAVTMVDALKGSPARSPRNHETAKGRLTSREQEVMRLLAEGFKVKEVAGMLYISPKTVENHKTSIMRKLKLHSFLELVRYAAKIELIDVELWKA